jgi:phosphatidylserine decarboxylase
LAASVYLLISVSVAAGLTISYLFWRKVWFYRNPDRSPPAEAGIVSPADGTVVYVRSVAPREDVIAIKNGIRATVEDILREDVDEPKLVIGIFMSPFDVHFNRAPIDALVGFIRRHPAHGKNAYMTAMHWRTLLGLEPYAAGSVHIVQNERTVTHFIGQHQGASLSIYVVQIGARTVNGIDSYCRPGDRLARGTTFGMIRIGSQVDLIVPRRSSLKARVRPGDRVRAGETIVIA